mmetsp:Transcript_18647/g.64201  ORF Transcript_18647/g.64201 Transcript_18647/m.64201 type:complete len:444 (+) Transcript_18647:1085-2416(+)
MCSSCSRSWMKASKGQAVRASRKHGTCESSHAVATAHRSNTARSKTCGVPPAADSTSETSATRSATRVRASATRATKQSAPPPQLSPSAWTVSSEATTTMHAVARNRKSSRASSCSASSSGEEGETRRASWSNPPTWAKRHRAAAVACSASQTPRSARAAASPPQRKRPAKRRRHFRPQRAFCASSDAPASESSAPMPHLRASPSAASASRVAGASGKGSFSKSALSALPRAGSPRRLRATSAKVSRRASETPRLTSLRSTFGAEISPQAARSAAAASSALASSAIFQTTRAAAPAARTASVSDAAPEARRTLSTSFEQSSSVMIERWNSSWTNSNNSSKTPDRLFASGSETSRDWQYFASNVCAIALLRTALEVSQSCSSRSHPASSTTSSEATRAQSPESLRRMRQSASPFGKKRKRRAPRWSKASSSAKASAAAARTLPD